MVHYSKRLSGVDHRLVSIVAALDIDVAVICGVRSKESQDAAFEEKRSKLRWPDSKHNLNPPTRELAEAVDLCPHPIDWQNTRAFIFMAGMVMQEAYRQGIKLRWGGDWSLDGIGDEKDDRFQDLGHFELLEG